MNVTINTDASFCPITKAAGFAFWITCDNGRSKVSWTVKNAETPTDAEIKCIANAIYYLEKSKFNNGKINRIFINSDCKPCFGLIRRKSPNKIGRFIANHLRKIFKDNPRKTNDVRYELRHVKAHTGDLTEKRSFVNNWCDKEAKKEMRYIRDRR